VDSVRGMLAPRIVRLGGFQQKDQTMTDLADLLAQNLHEPASLLRAIGSPKVKALVAEFPLFCELVEAPGRGLGKGAQPELVMKMWCDALEEGSKACQAAAPALRTKLRSADGFQFAGELVSFVSSSTLLAMILAKGTSDTPKIVAGALALVTTVTASVAGFLRKGTKGDRVELHGRMVRLAGEADVLIIQFKIWASASEPASKEATALAEKATGVVKEMREILASA
jgi:hypothetical protein